MANVTFDAARDGRVVVDGDQGAVESEFELAPKGGDRFIQRQVAFQTWKNGKVVREVFLLLQGLGGRAAHRIGQHDNQRRQYRQNAKAQPQ